MARVTACSIHGQVTIDEGIGLGAVPIADHGQVLFADDPVSKDPHRRARRVLLEHPGMDTRVGHEPPAEVTGFEIHELDAGTQAVHGLAQIFLFAGELIEIPQAIEPPGTPAMWGAHHVRGGHDVILRLPIPQAAAVHPTIGDGRRAEALCMNRTWHLALGGESGTSEAACPYRFAPPPQQAGT